MHLRWKRAACGPRGSQAPCRQPSPDGHRMAANVRHELERHGHDAATALLKQYQREIATDWIAAYRKYVSPTP